MRNYFIPIAILSIISLSSTNLVSQEKNTLPNLTGGAVPKTFDEMWTGFNPRAEPLETEVLHEWEEDGVVMRIVRFRIGVFKGQKAKLAAIYGFPKEIADSGEVVPGLVQIHGGGQFADHKACLMNAKRGYATVSIAWAGRISAPKYRVSREEVKLFWDGKTDDPRYKLTTDWGAVDGYHAPSRNPKNVFPSAKAGSWTIDDVESPRNSSWFLCALAGRRALTFLERQPEVDADRLGVYGHSMGGKLTVMTSIDPRVKAAAPSCGGISDRVNSSELFAATIGDHNSLQKVSCPIIFLSPANDFHGRIGDLPAAIDDIKSKTWRVTCSPHRNHQDSAEYEVATLLWFDTHLQHTFDFPKTPQTKITFHQAAGVPTINVKPDTSRKPLSVDVYYTQHGKSVELPSDRENTMNRFWRHAATTSNGDHWTASLPIISVDKPLWVYANVSYALEQPVSGAGYYYGTYTADTFNVSSVLEKFSAEQLKARGVKATLKPSLMIESFDDDWEREWFTYKPETWPRATHKLYDAQWKAPENAELVFQVRSEQPNTLVVSIDGHVAVVDIQETDVWKSVSLSPGNFKNFSNEPLPSWSNIRRLKLGDAERLRPPRGSQIPSRIVGKNWQGPAPEFRDLRWQVTSQDN